MTKRMALCILSALLTAVCMGCGSQNNTKNVSAEDVTPAAPTETLMSELSGTPAATPTATALPTEAPTATPTDALTPGAETTDITVQCPADVLAKRDTVSYASFEHGTYYSSICDTTRGYTVLLPPGYTTEKKYPVVYLLHGIFGNENSFAGDKTLPVLIDNMMADGLCGEFILVCPDIFAGGNGFVTTPAFTVEAMAAYDRFAQELITCLMPEINGKYAVMEGRDGTAIAGFSMGGRETLYTSLLYPEYFSEVCAIAPAPGIVECTDKFMHHEGSLKEEEVKYKAGTILPNHILICCAKRDSVVGQYPSSYAQLYERNGIPRIWYEIPDADHDQRAQYSGLYNFLQWIGK